MCLIRCHVKFNGTPSGPGIHRGPGHHHGTHRHRQRQYRVRTAHGCVRTNAGSIDAGGTILSTNSRGTEGLRAPTTNNRPAAADHRPTIETVPAPAMRPHRDGTTNTNPEEQREEALERPPAPGTNEELQQELNDMTRDARQSGEEVRGLRTQLANALMLAARTAPAAPHTQEDRGRKFPDSPDFSGSDRTQLRG